MGDIKIKGIKVYAYHGDLKEEQKLGGHFLVDVLLEFDSANVEKSDDLSDTVDYVKVVETVENIMQTPSKMLEHIAGRIANKLCELKNVCGVKVEIEKMSPPINANFKKISVVISR